MNVLHTQLCVVWVSAFCQVRSAARAGRRRAAGPAGVAQRSSAALLRATGGAVAVRRSQSVGQWMILRRHPSHCAGDVPSSLSVYVIVGAVAGMCCCSWYLWLLLLLSPSPSSLLCLFFFSSSSPSSSLRHSVPLMLISSNTTRQVLRPPAHWPRSRSARPPPPRGGCQEQRHCQQHQQQRRQRRHCRWRWCWRCHHGCLCCQ